MYSNLSIFFLFFKANAQPFSIFYTTNGDETSTPTVDTPGTGNRGFCLSFQQQ